MKNYNISNGIINIISVFILCLSILYVRHYYNSDQLADYDAYAYFTDLYWSGFDRSWLTSEPFGWGTLLSLRALTGTTEEAIVFAHWLLGAFTCFSILALAIRYNLQWQGVMLSIAMFGPLLSMVTIRATPTYLMCVVSALTIRKNPTLGIILALSAALFHNTAFLSFFPILLIIIQDRFQWLNRKFRNKPALVISSTFIALLFVLFRQSMFSILEQMISFLPGFAEKYIVYFSLGNSETPITAEPSIFHNFFIGGVTLIFALYLILGKEVQEKYVAFAVASFAIFIMLSANPVTSYRQSIFWIVPILLTFPWERLKPNFLAYLGIISFSLVVFAININGIILK